MRRLMILGGSIGQVGTIKRAKEMGLSTIVVDRDRDCLGFKYCDTPVYMSVKESDTLLKIAKDLDIDGVIAPCADVATDTAGYINSCLSLRGPNTLSVIMANDKRITYDLLQLAYVDLPERYTDIDSIPQFPVIVKPYDGVASRNVYKVHDKEELKQYDSSYIIEEFIEGTVVNVDMIMQNGICKCWTMVDEMISLHNFGACMFTYPSVHFEKMSTAILMTSSAVQDALGIMDGNISIEGIVSKGKFYVIDVHPRLAGGFLGEAHTYSRGTDWIGDSIRAALGDYIEFQVYADVGNAFILDLVGSKVDGNVLGVAIEQSSLSNDFKSEVFVCKVGDIKSSNTRETSSDQVIYVLYVEGKDKNQCRNNWKKFSKQVKAIIEPYKEGE